MVDEKHNVITIDMCIQLLYDEDYIWWMIPQLNHYSNEAISNPFLSIPISYVYQFAIVFI